jgi:hypothetical protein
MDTTHNALVFMYESFMRDTENEIIINHIKTYIEHLQTLPDINQQNTYIEYLIVMMFATRNCRGGKGERNIFIQMWNTIYQYYPSQLDSLIQFIPHYGSWRDVVSLIIMGTEESRCHLYEFIVSGLRKDIAKETTSELSYVAKWCPKEGSAADKKCNAARECAKRLYPELYTEHFTSALRKYRQDVSRLNKALQTTEILMCNKQFSKINFNNVPKKALVKYNSAFLNVSVMDKNETRHPDDDDRKECCIHYEQYLSSTRATATTTATATKNNTLLLHEIIDKIQKTSNQIEIDELELVWNTSMNSHNYALSNGILFTTMNDSYNISTTLAMAIGSQQTVPAFKNRCITCANEPIFIEMPINYSLLETITHINKNIKPASSSIDFKKTMQLILTQARIYRLYPEQLPKWCLFLCEPLHISDICCETIIAEFEKVGIEVCGKPYTMPRIIVWNVHNNTTQYPVVYNEPAYKLIHGYSPTLMKDILYNNISKVESITPWMNLKYILDGYDYELLRTSIRQQFKPIDTTMDDTEVVSPTCNSPPPPTKETSILHYLRSFF